MSSKLILVLLGAPSGRWAPLGTAGHRWAPLGTAGHCWAPLGTAGHRWAPLGTAGRRCGLLGAAGHICANFATCSWEPLTMLNPQFVAGEHGLFGGHKSEDIRTFF